MNIERLLDTILNANDTYAMYSSLSAKYRKANCGCGVYFYNGKKLSAEEQRIEYYYHEDNADRGAVSAVFEVLGFDRDQIARAYIAARSLRRWYERTEWQFCPGDNLKAALEKFVIG